ncbi:hypothetical protein LAC1533_1360 [Ligilactobacillus acidipiscis]|uniref:Uncharacterized protein n=1 Tax=Ligilactobacillus acidipiscis TaxID=89059 RepID=A0A1K1KPI8_9LACO|nr:hypothetical protein LAC1533_1360 [Ligilactobacillus acidipiscis]
MLFKRIKGAIFYENILGYYSATFNYRINNLGYKKNTKSQFKSKAKDI